MSSLTAFLKSNLSLPYRQVASSLLNKYIVTKSGIGLHKDRCLAIRYPEVGDYGLVGTAFDYALRTRLSLRKGKIIKKEDTVAYSSYKLVKDIQLDYVPYDTLLSRTILSILKEFERIQEDALKNLDQSGISGNLLLTLLGSCLKLARIDSIYRGRAGELKDFDITYTQDHLEDMLYLWCNTEIDFFSAHQKEKLNPVIGSFGHAISCSDGDLILDNKMIDIKTVKYKKDLEYIMQSLSYLIMYNCKFLLKIETYDMPKDIFQFKNLTSFIQYVTGNDKLLSEVGIYYSRHAEYTYIDLDNIPDKEAYQLYTSFIECANGI